MGGRQAWALLAAALYGLVATMGLLVAASLLVEVEPETLAVPMMVISVVTVLLQAGVVRSLFFEYLLASRDGGGGIPVLLRGLLVAYTLALVVLAYRAVVYVSLVLGASNVYRTLVQPELALLINVFILALSLVSYYFVARPPSGYARAWLRRVLRRCFRTRR